MKNLKKYLFILILLALLPFINVKACENKEQLVRDNYDYLTGLMPEFVIEQKTCDEIEFFVENNFQLVSTSEVSDADLYPTRASDTHSTVSKTLTLHHYESGTTDYVTLSNSWKTLPNVRSHDVIGLRFESISYQLSNTNCYFRYDDSSTTYTEYSDSSSSNITYASNGVGFTYKLPTGSNINSMYFFLDTITSGSGYIYGSYQHAKSSVTKAQAMNYVFSASGLGNVIYHASATIRAKYDGMSGVSVSV